jgi:hypothetical protein
VLCPPGRFTIQTGAALHGRELVLGDGTVSLPGMCPVVHAERFTGHGWTHLSARWRRCPRRALAMRARFDLDRTSYCTRLEGVLRTGTRRRVPFVADRIRECGNGVREDGEQCDGGDGAIFGFDCCRRLPHQARLSGHAARRGPPCRAPARSACTTASASARRAPPSVHVAGLRLRAPGHLASMRRVGSGTGASLRRTCPQ